MDEWLAKANEFPNLGAAEQWRQQNGVAVVGLPSPELSSRLTDPQRMTSPLASVNMRQTPQEQAPMPNAMPEGALTSATMSELGELSKEQQAYAADVERRYKDRFEQGQQRIAQLYGGPSTSETLFALGNALLAPKRYSGFGGTMYNVNRALSDIGTRRRESDQQRAQALAELEASYEQGVDKSKLSSLEARRKLLEAKLEQEAELAKARAPKFDMNPVTGAYQTRPGTGDNLGVLTPEQVLALKQDPRNKGKTFYTTDGRPGVF